jgi:KaiC
MDEGVEEVTVTESHSLAEASVLPRLAKAQTGIDGLDEVTDGGLPRARTTLLCGGPGVRQDVDGDAVHGPRRAGVRGAGGVCRV